MSLRKSLTRRMSKPLRALKVFTPKSKSKGQDADSQTSASETASLASSAPPAEPTIAKVVVQAHIVNEAQRPEEQVTDEKQRVEHEAERQSSHDQLDNTPSSESEPQNVVSAPQPSPDVPAVTEEPTPILPLTPDVDASKPASVSDEHRDDAEPRSPEPSTDVVEPPTTDAVVDAKDAQSEGQEVIVAVEESIPSADVVEKDVQVVVDVEEKAASDANSSQAQPLAESEFVVVDHSDDASLPPPATVVELFEDKGKDDMDVPTPEEQPAPLSTAVVSSNATLEDPVADINPFIEDVPLAASTEIVASSEEKPSDVSPVSSPDASNASVLSHPLSELPNTPLNVNKDVPPSPPAASTSASDSDSEEAAPVVHAPGITLPTLFLPIPNTDPLTTLLIKHVPDSHMRPPRDVSGDWQQSDFHTLVMTNNWRALARMARDRIVQADPSDIEVILSLWYVRLSSLARLRLFNQVSAECDNLFVALSSIEPPAAQSYVFNNVLPFELEVLQARCTYWAGDPLGYLDDVSILHRRCKLKARAASEKSDVEMWKERGARMCLIMASQLAEMKDFTAAASLLEPLYKSSQSPVLLSAIARIYLQAGNVLSATRLFEKVAADADAEASLKTSNSAMLAAVNGDWRTSAELYAQLMSMDQGDIVAINNYAVSLLGEGRVKDGIHVLETALQASPSAITTTEPFLFNLSTLYELRSGLTAHKKRDLLIEVAKWSGDGVRTACLKLPAA
ncbi:hypothetical protein SCHPADRAFT_900131 [Schizopora paradoxa]|uniref:Uncharacterized protein n=1 Tax=Schizopora paradoxa TaxID=27342 RepID=A0A0H2SLK5_9AGAM|nr:hypothetical protein SCHPADRAFT_900131 [Schizopora paradoxa]